MPVCIEEDVHAELESGIRDHAGIIVASAVAQHQVLATMMRTVADRNIPPSQVTPDMLEGAIKEYTGRDIRIGQHVLDRLFDAMECVKERKCRGGAAPERVREHIAAARKNIVEDRRHVTEWSMRVEAAQHRLDGAFAALQKRFGN